jgi:hypothetical protein
MFLVKAFTFPSAISNQKCVGHAKRMERKTRKAGETGKATFLLN